MQVESAYRDGHIDCSNLRFEWTPPDNWQTLAEDWQRLEAHTRCSVFLSWPWIEIWCRTYQSASQVCRVYDGETLVGIGIWARQSHRRPLGLDVTTLHLQHCGVVSRDQIWPEYNELLCLPDYRNAVHQALLSHVPKHLCVNEVDLGVSDQALQKTMAQSQTKQWLCEERWSTTVIAVKVDQFENYHAYLSSLSSSFRYQLRRSERGLEKIGAVRLEFAQDVETAQSWFIEDGQAHIAQWGEDSGFCNPEFVRFHRNWITRAFEQCDSGNEKTTGSCDNLVMMVRLIAGNHVVSGAYLFSYRNVLYYYLGFARQDWGPKVKTGLCLHLKLIEFAFQKQFSMYDFMGGDYAYKRKFGEPVMQLSQCRFKPKTVSNRCEKALKTIRQKLRAANLSSKR